MAIDLHMILYLITASACHVDIRCNFGGHVHCLSVSGSVSDLRLLGNFLHCTLEGNCTVICTFWCRVTEETQPQRFRSSQWRSRKLVHVWHSSWLPDYSASGPPICFHVQSQTETYNIEIAEVERLVASEADVVIVLCFLPFLPRCWLVLLSISPSENGVWSVMMAADVFKSEQCYTPAHHSSSHHATVLTDDVLIYGKLNQLSEALSSISLSCLLSHNVSPSVVLLSYQGLSSQSVVCFHKSNTTDLVAAGNISSWVVRPAMEIDRRI